MAFYKGRFGLFWSLPPDALDWANLDASRVRLVMLMLEHARPDTLLALADRGCKVIIRVNENDYYADDAPLKIAARAIMVRQVCPVDAVICGNEPENAQNLAYGSATFGQDFAFVHRKRFDDVRILLQQTGVRVISPAFTCRMITESDKPQPGEQTWWDICTDTDDKRVPGDGQFGYHSADGNGAHCYQHNWLGPVDEIRFAFMLQRLQTTFHKPLWIDEVGINSGTELERMAAYIDMAEMLLDRKYYYGQRVEFFTPFVANGDPGFPPAWSPGYLIRSHAAYEMLGNWMAV